MLLSDNCLGIALALCFFSGLLSLTLDILFLKNCVPGLMFGSAGTGDVSHISVAEFESQPYSDSSFLSVCTPGGLRCLRWPLGACCVPRLLTGLHPPGCWGAWGVNKVNGRAYTVSHSLCLSDRFLKKVSLVKFDFIIVNTKLI